VLAPWKFASEGFLAPLNGFLAGPVSEDALMKEGRGVV